VDKESEGDDTGKQKITRREEQEEEERKKEQQQKEAEQQQREAEQEREEAHDPDTDLVWRDANGKIICLFFSDIIYRGGPSNSTRKCGRLHFLVWGELCCAQHTAVQPGALWELLCS